MKEKFENRRVDGTICVKMDEAKGTWHGDKRIIIDAIIDIAKEYQRGSYVLTLRQLYYQLVARDIIPNHDKVYKKISAIKDDAVYSGLVDWDVFEDRGRVPQQAYYEDDVPGALQRTIDNYYLDRQDGQDNHVEVWTEKDAISSILKRVTNQYTIRLVVNKGYTSSTAIYGAYERFLQKIWHGNKITILYFGDHDPSGLDMIRDIYDRLMFMFTKGEQLFGGDFEDILNDWWKLNEYNIYTVADMGEEYESVVRLADDDNEKLEELFEKGKRELFIKEKELFKIIPVGLTMEQIKQYNPPHNPAKITDPRAKGYIREYGKISWEVDALSPKIMQEIVKNAIESQINIDQYESVKIKEKEEKEIIKGLIDGLN